MEVAAEAEVPAEGEGALAGEGEGEGSDGEYETMSEEEMAGSAGEEVEGEECPRCRGESYAFVPYRVSLVQVRGREAPRARSGHRLVCGAGGELYSFGGYNPSPPASGEEAGDGWSLDLPLFKELWSYSVARRMWRRMRLRGDIPDELASHAMCAVRDNILVFGGTGIPFGGSCSNNLLIYNTSDPKKGLQLIDTHGERPPEHYGHAILCVGHHFYSIGGTDGFDYTSDIYRLNLRTLKWKPIYVQHGELDGEPAGRYRHELAFDGRDIYILGGGTSISPYDLVFLYVFNLEKKTWSCVSTNLDTSITSRTRGPLPRKCHSAVQIDTPDGIQVFVMGGTDGMKVFDDVWRLDLRTLQWTLMRKTVLPKLLYFHSSTVTPEGCMYTFGGIEDRGWRSRDETPKRVNDMYKVWLCIPKLSEICWEALLYYNPDLDLKDRSVLLNCGVPIKFVERLT